MDFCSLAVYNHLEDIKGAFAHFFCKYIHNVPTEPLRVLGVVVGIF